MFELIIFSVFAGVALLAALIVALVLAILTRSDVATLRQRVERAEAELRGLRAAPPRAPESTTLVGIGYLYQRFVFPKAAAPAAA